MAYVGINIKHENGNLKVKLHGPTDKVHVNTANLLGDVNERLTRAHLNLMDLCKDVSQHVIDKYGNGDDIIWAEIEIETPTGILIGASAEKVLVS